MNGLARIPRRVLGSAFGTSAWTTLGFVLLAGVGGVVAARFLGPTQRGLLATAVVWSSVVGSMSAYGMPDVSAFFTARDRQRPPRDTATALALAACAGGLVAVGGAGATVLFVSGAVVPAMVVAFAGMLPIIVGGAAQGAVLGMGRYRAWGLVRMLLPGLTLVGVVLAASMGWRTALAVTTVTVGAALTQLAVIALLLRRHGRLHRPDRARARPMLAYMWRSVVAGTGFLLAGRLDQLMLSVLVAPNLLGFYAVAVSFGAIIQPLAGSAAAVVLRRVATGGIGALRPALTRGLGVALAIAGGLALPTGVLAPQLVRWLFGDAFSPSATSVRLLMIGAVALALSSVLAAALRGLGKPLVPASATMLGALTTLVLLPTLLGPLGIEGAAVANSASAAVIMVGMAVSLRVTVMRMRDAPALDAQNQTSA